MVVRCAAWLFGAPAGGAAATGADWAALAGGVFFVPDVAAATPRDDETAFPGGIGTATGRPA